MAQLRDVLDFLRLRPKPGSQECVRARKAEGDESALPTWIYEHFQQHQYQLLRLLWLRGVRQEVAITEICRALYDKPKCNDEALKKVKDRTNKKLLDINRLYEIIIRGESYVLVPIERR